jgi:RNA polymerase sigma-70 factor (ECF subfamily)
VATPQQSSGADAEATHLAAALAGDSEAFRELTEPYVRELHVHCYRLLGSFHDAEDAVQETLLRAWRHLASFEGRSSFRAWLYRIATNVSLTQRRRSRVELPLLPDALAQAVAEGAEPAVQLTPYPDALLDELVATSGDPATEAELRESVQLAFLAAVQLLPPRQRAVLILRDVVGFPADTVAEMLHSTTASVNSALNRARATLEQQRKAGRLHAGRTPAPDGRARDLVRRYGEAWLSMDIGKLVGLLKRDVVMTMPPLPVRISGRNAVIDFLGSLPLARSDRVRLVPTRANRQPALAVYLRDAHGQAYSAWGIWVLAVDSDSDHDSDMVAEITAFVDPTMIPLFGLPLEL